MTNIVIEQALFLIGTVYHHKSTHGLFSIAVFNYQRVTHKKKDLSQVYIDMDRFISYTFGGAE